MSCTPPNRDLAHNPSLCPDWELNQRPFGLQAGTQSNHPTDQGTYLFQTDFRKRERERVRRREEGRERDWFVVPLIYAFIGWLLYVLWPGITSAVSAYWDDALTNWATRPVLYCIYSIHLSIDGHLDFFHILAVVNNAAVNQLDPSWNSSTKPALPPLSVSTPTSLWSDSRDWLLRCWNFPVNIHCRAWCVSAANSGLSSGSCPPFSSQYQKCVCFLSVILFFGKYQTVLSDFFYQFQLASWSEHWMYMTLEMSLEGWYRLWFLHLVICEESNPWIFVPLQAGCYESKPHH